MAAVCSTATDLLGRLQSSPTVIAQPQPTVTVTVAPDDTSLGTFRVGPLDDAMLAREEEAVRAIFLKMSRRGS
jgi:hypothetical protein